MYDRATLAEWHKVCLAHNIVIVTDRFTASWCWSAG
ncbi:hypothetical protein EMGBD1_23980, partial [Anaerolineaceae bacterium]